MIEALALILLCQLAGEVTVLATGLPVPGPVLGMLLLLGWLWWRGGISERVERTADTLLGNLSLLFVPAGVGVMIHWGRVQEQWAGIAAALFIGTPLAILVTALTMAGVQRLRSGHREDPRE
jgi:holin-like protein